MRSLETSEEALASLMSPKAATLALKNSQHLSTIVLLGVIGKEIPSSCLLPREEKKRGLDAEHSGFPGVRSCLRDWLLSCSSGVLTGLNLPQPPGVLSAKQYGQQRAVFPEDHPHPCQPSSQRPALRQSENRCVFIVSVFEGLPEGLITVLLVSQDRQHQ